MFKNLIEFFYLIMVYRYEDDPSSIMFSGNDLLGVMIENFKVSGKASPEFEGDNPIHKYLMDQKAKGEAPTLINRAEIRVEDALRREIPGALSLEIISDLTPTYSLILGYIGESV